MKRNNIKWIFILALFGSWGSYAKQISSDGTQKPNKYHYTLSFDRHYSEKSCGDLAFSLLQGYRQFEETSPLSDYYDHSVVAYRWARFFLCASVASFLSVAQHEIGGHGAQARKFGLKASYRVSAWTGGHAAIKGDSYRKFLKLHHNEKTMFFLGGLHAQESLSEVIKSRCLMENEVNPNYAFFYYINKSTQPTYILSTEDENNTPGHDIDLYIKSVNEFYGVDYLTASQLKKLSYWSFLDPLLFYSIHPMFTNKTIETPTFPIKVPGISDPVGFLPSIQLLLTPYGPEMGLVNSFKLADRYHQIALLHGKNQHIKSYGIAVKSSQWFTYRKLTVGGELRWWLQPQLLTAGDFKQVPMKQGGRSTC